MYTKCERSLKLAFDRRHIFSIIFLVSVILNVAWGEKLFNSYEDDEEFQVQVLESILKEISHRIREEEAFLRGAKTVMETMSSEFKYPVKTKLIMTKPVTKRESDQITTRFRRDDIIAQSGSLNNYMNTYYAQRQAIMEKYKSQRKKIMERLEKTRNQTEAKKKAKDLKSKENATLDQNSKVSPHPNVTAVTSKKVKSNFNNEVTRNVTHFYNKTPILNNIQPSISDVKKLHRDEMEKNSTETMTTVLPKYETLRPFDNNDIEDIKRPDEMSETNQPLVSINLSPQDEVVFNLTEENRPKQERDNDTLIIDLGLSFTDPPKRNNSASAELEKMFLWDVPSRFGLNRTRSVTEIDNPSEKMDTIVSENKSNGSFQSIKIKSSPEMQITNNVKNVKTTTYKNSTHEIVEVNGVVNSTKRIADLSPGIDQYIKEIILKNPNASESTQIGGGANESEWCEECPHDYRWGECEGTLFYQHNIFLRNRGPSAIDAIFGMDVQGPVNITCVEALRFNQTRGIVSLHSGGPGYDYSKLRIRGFQGEGFSYIMKVWGIHNEDYISSNSYS